MTLSKRTALGAGLLALSTSVAGADPAIVTNDLNLRAGPGTGFSILAAMPAGMTVDVQACTGSWCQVNFAGMQGFAHQSFLGIGGSAAVAPAFGGSFARSESISTPQRGTTTGAAGAAVRAGPQRAASTGAAPAAARGNFDVGGSGSMGFRATNEGQILPVAPASAEARVSAVDKAGVGDKAIAGDKASAKVDKKAGSAKKKARIGTGESAGPQSKPTPQPRTTTGTGTGY